MENQLHSSNLKNLGILITFPSALKHVWWISFISGVCTHSALYTRSRWGSAGCTGEWKVRFSSCFSIIHLALSGKRLFLSHIPWHPESPVAAGSGSSLPFQGSFSSCTAVVSPRGWWVLWAQISSGRFLAPWVLLWRQKPEVTWAGTAQLSEQAQLLLVTLFVCCSPRFSSPNYLLPLVIL